MAAPWKIFVRLSVTLTMLSATLLTLPHVRGVFVGSGAGDGPRLDVTRLFSFEANSTCGGEPPTLFETRSGELVNCSVGEHNASFAVDGDPNTRWQSQNGDDPITLTFSLSETSTFLTLALINLYVAHYPPQVLVFEVRARGSSGFLPIQAYVLNDQDGSCEDFDNLNVLCSNYSVGDPDISGNTNVTVLSCPLNVLMPVEEFRLITYGFLPSISPEAQYHTLAEVEIFANIAEGYFSRSLHSIVTEGEIGRRMDNGTQVEIGADTITFPRFSFRGYAQLEFSSNERVLVQWIFPLLPQTTNYRFIVRYRNLGNSRRLVGSVSQGGTTMNSRITFVRENDCVHPCFAVLENPATPQNPEPANFPLNDQDPVTITITFSSTSILLDAIIALPEEFFNPSNSSIIDNFRFIQECNISSGELRPESPLTSHFCIESAIQLSLEFFCATPACECQSPGSSGQECEVYGGQCVCIEAEVEQGFSAVHGRQCDLCPFYSYLTPDGCTSCSCPSPLDNCDLMTGQCSNCPPLVEGRSCNVCVANSFGDPSIGCMRCGCNETGSQSCNQVTGECICKPGVDGTSCDLCMEGWFNFTSSGCASCDCDTVGSEGINCSMTGQCSCKNGVGGMRCSDCDDGFFAFSSAGCLLCNCSGRTSNCQLDPTSPISDPQELCQCPFPYDGNTCEHCLDGYYLSSQTGNCELCQCNGRADSCQDGTGECINCTDNTTGANCGECLNGFYSVDLETDLECQLCPCITTTAFNISCQPDINGNPECFCRPGHNRPLCDSCSEGYFGSPPDLRCRSCDCNGNIDPDVPGSCDRETGICLMCINNSTGPECEVCADGYYGDATTQNCQPCGCYEGGAVEASCNSTGYCTCLIGVGGQRCDMCLRGYWNFTDGVGCVQCMCAGGSISNDCDEVTGMCRCNEGVGEDDCSACLDGFFNFTNSGCTACECGIGAVDSTCSPDDGRCTCQPGVMGDKCDQCEPYYTNLSSSGCQPCSECEQGLRTNLSFTEDEHDRLSADLVQLMSLQQANDSGLEDVYMLIRLLEENVTITEEYLNNTVDRLEVLNSKATGFRDNLNNTAERVSNASMTSIDLSPYAEDVHEHIVEVSNNVQEVQIDTGNVLRFANLVNQTVQGQLNIAQIAATYASEIEGQHDRNYTVTMDIDEAMQAFIEAEQVNDDAQNLHRLVQSQLGQSQNLSSDFQYLNDSLEILLLQAADLRDNENNLRARLSNITLTTNQLELNLSVINHTIIFATLALDSAEQTVRQAEYVLIMVMEDIRTLAALVGELPIDEENTFSSGSGSGFESDISPETMPDTLTGGIELLRRTVTELEGMFSECSGIIQQGKDHAANVSIQANQISSILSPSLTSGNGAVEAIIDYDESITMIQEAFKLTVLANETISGTLANISDLMTDGLAATAAMLVNTSMELLDEAERLYGVIRELLPAVDEARQAYERAENQTLQISNLVIMLSHDVNELTRAVSMNHVMLNNILNTIQERLDIVYMIHEYVISVVPVLKQNVNNSQVQLDEIQGTYFDVDNILESTNATAMDALEAFTNRSLLLNDITTLSSSNQGELEALNNSIDSLQQQLERALQAAASIDLALRFYGNSSHSFFIPTEVTVAPSYSTTISMVFQPEETTSGLMFTTGENQADSGVALRVRNGSVQFEYHSASKAMNVYVSGISEEKWYQLYASVDTNVLALSVAPLQSDGPSIMALRETSSPLSPLSFSSEDVILLGGAQSLADIGSTPSDGFSGCLDRVVVNSVQVSLLLPNEMNRNLATCSPRPPAEFPRQFENGVWLQESASFILTNLSSQLPSTAEPFEISFAFRTFSLDGILIYLADVSTTHYLLVYFRNGQVVLDFSLTGLDFGQLNTTNIYNNGQWYDVSVVLEGSSVTLTVGVEVLVMDALISSAFDPSGILSIGSPIQAIAIGGDVTAQQAAALQSVITEPWFSTSGCFRSLQLNGLMVNISEIALLQQKVSLDGCPAEVSAGVRFMGNGYAQFRSPIQTDETIQLNISISFRGSQLAATLLHLGTQPQVSLSIFHTRLRVDVESFGLLVVSQTEMLNNNQWHTVTLTFMPDPLSDNFTTTELIVDGARDSYLTEEFDVPVLNSGDPLLIGGTTEEFAVVVAESFRGCIGEIIINNRSLYFTEASELVGVALYGCQPPSLVIPIPPPPPPLPPPPSPRPDTAVGLNGSDASFIALVISEEEVLRGFSIVLEFQTASSEAILLYLQGSVHADFVALQLTGGILVFSFNLGSGRVDIESEGTYNDGEIHTVELRRFEQYGVMIIDGIEIRNGSSPGTFTALNINNGYLFLGGIPEFINYVSLFQGGEEQPPGLLACFYGVSINGVYESLDTTDIQAGMGLEPCISSYNNVAYFGANSYSQIFNNFYAGKRFTFSMDIRTHNCTGILLYVATPLYPDHFLLELVDGRLRFVFDNGPGEEVVEYIPASDPMELCDGQWHSLVIEKDGETGYLEVDGGSRLSVTSQFSRFLAINTNDPLYVGGVPESVRLRFTVQNGSFQGCINNLSLSQDGRDPQSIPLFQSTVMQNVNLYVCRL